MIGHGSFAGHSHLSSSSVCVPYEIATVGVTVSAFTTCATVDKITIIFFAELSQSSFICYTAGECTKECTGFSQQYCEKRIVVLEYKARLQLSTEGPANWRV